MNRHEAIGRIVEHLHAMDNASLEKLLTELLGDITDSTLNVITHGKNDTEHLLSSPVNASDLNQAAKELKGIKLLAHEPTA
jgi:hypothetical protein